MSTAEFEGGSERVRRPWVGAIDIAVFVGASVLGILFENLAIAKGWMEHIPVGVGVMPVLTGVASVILLAFLRGGNLGTLGLRRPARWGTVPLWVIGILAVYFYAQVQLPSLLSGFVDLPKPDVSGYDAIKGNLPAAVAMALTLPFTASIPEEIIYRGFLTDRFGKIFGYGTLGTIASVVGQAAVFGSAHTHWGFGGVIITFMMGLIWGSAYVLCGRNLWIVILAHSAGHTIWVAQLYMA